MPPVNRNEPKRTACSQSTYSLMEFMREFPDDAACLEHLWRERYAPDGEHAHCPKCDRERTFRRYATGRQSWCCTGCGHHIYPTAGTIFHKSSTSLHLWFFACYLMASTRCGLSAKQLERAIGVSYPTAWRMLNRIRNELMADDGASLRGDVEVDETSVDGKPRKPQMRPGSVPGRRSEAAKLRERSRATVFAAVERGGRIKATVLPSRRGPGLKRQVIEWVDPASIVFTDEWPAYNGLDLHFISHSRVRHAAGEYVVGDTHTNTVEGFFGLVKPAIKGTYRKVSHRWLQGYLNEFTWRYDHRNQREPSMFHELVSRASELAR
ncbi:MAG TPA: IS1595 family transposase [Solirubrobacteraceae bacterium]|nr:IS1595 family transposase [Solirubrobacteraceae bacterium]